MTDLTVLGVETSCDETAAAVVRLSATGEVCVLSSVVGLQTEQHAPFGGVVPEIAARAHVEAIDGVAAEAMARAGIRWEDVSGVAATAGPGLIGGVMVGLAFGKAVALARGLPLVAAPPADPRHARPPGCCSRCGRISWVVPSPTAPLPSSSSGRVPAKLW